MLAPEPTQTPLPIVTSTPKQTLTPTATPTATPDPKPKDIDVWQIIIANKYLPKDLITKRVEEGININWEGHTYLFTCGEKTEDGENLLWKIVGSERTMDVTSTIGFIPTIWFFEEDYEDFDVEGEINAILTSSLHLMFDPLHCEFVVTTNQKETLDKCPWEITPFSLTGDLSEVTTKLVEFHSVDTEIQGTMYIYIDNKNNNFKRPVLMELETQDEIFGKSRCYMGNIDSYGYIYQENGEIFTSYQEKGDGCPDLALRVSQTQDEETQ